MLAQALIERGLLDSAITGLGALLLRGSFIIQEHPWVWVVVALVLAMLIRGGSRRGNF